MRGMIHENFCAGRGSDRFLQESLLFHFEGQILFRNSFNECLWLIDTSVLLPELPRVNTFLQGNYKQEQHKEDQKNKSIDNK